MSNGFEISHTRTALEHGPSTITHATVYQTAPIVESKYNKTKKKTNLPFGNGTAAVRCITDIVCIHFGVVAAADDDEDDDGDDGLVDCVRSHMRTHASTTITQFSKKHRILYD